MNMLFERLSLQAHLRRVLDQYPDQGWQIIREAIERELRSRLVRQKPGNSSGPVKYRHEATRHPQSVPHRQS